MSLSKLAPKFSPASWFVDRRRVECVNVVSVIRRQGNGTITVVDVHDDSGRLTQERLADAQLIACAPDMYLELVRLREQLEIAETIGVFKAADVVETMHRVDRLLVRATTLPDVVPHD